VKLSEVGLYRWREWSGTEKSYFVQLLIIANVVFVLMLSDRLRTILAEPSGMRQVLTVMLPSLLWGFYQELVYRGLLQTELVRRWGPVAGILVTNTLFTFGPLHFYHFARTSPALPMFAGIFAIGLFFGVVFQRRAIYGWSPSPTVSVTSTWKAREDSESQRGTCAPCRSDVLLWWPESSSRWIEPWPPNTYQPSPRQVRKPSPSGRARKNKRDR
ncbi:MAG: CPBP family intramembrane metalloprotease, partial [Actinomycetota bacterium]|nr:CPBP family intramembrane metalloprotease [Actinomycetota bacterium]